MKKLTKFTLAALAVGTISTVAAMADDLNVVQRQNGHGQTIVMFESATPKTIAVYVGGSAAGAGTNAADLQQRATLSLQQMPNGHGQSVFAYRLTAEEQP